ncbi:S8 family serine peptidase [Candidatus Bathyarchaeota archaeon]|nr:S8 family serine peptidase [Candidatus Bathyarchaeota archaeon]
MTHGICRRLGVTRLWALGITGKGILVGIVGTGIDLSHPDLEGKVVASKDFSGHGISDDIGHDTAVAGVIASKGAKNWRLRGIAYDAQLVIVKVTQHDGSVEEDVLIDALEWLASQGVQVINFSITSDCVTDGRDPVSREVNYLVQKRGIGVVCAAGNYGPVHYSIGSPGAAEEAITVGCVNNQDVLRLASSRGPTLDGRVKPDCVAPGERILCARARNTTTCDIHSDLYGFFDLTSFATPHVTGIWVQLKQAFAGATPRQIKESIRGSCDPAYMPIVSRITSLPTGFFYRLQATLKRFFSRKKFDEKHSIGHGRVNAYRAYLKLKELMNVGKT